MTSKDNSKAALIDSLNGLLADTLALYVKTKNFHWHVRGPQFRSLHLLFDEQAAEIFALTDMIAERVRKMLGQYETPYIDPAVHEALQSYVARRKDEMPGAYG